MKKISYFIVLSILTTSLLCDISFAQPQSLRFGSNQFANFVTEDNLRATLWFISKDEERRCARPHDDAVIFVVIPNTEHRWDADIHASEAPSAFKWGWTEYTKACGYSPPAITVHVVVGGYPFRRGAASTFTFDRQLASGKVHCENNRKNKKWKCKVVRFTRG